MKKRITIPKVKHVLSDGTEIESIKGFVVPVNEKSIPVYNLLTSFLLKNNNVNKITA